MPVRPVHFLVLTLVAAVVGAGVASAARSLGLAVSRKNTGAGPLVRLLSVLVVGTGVDPVTFRFSGGRSAN